MAKIERDRQSEAVERLKLELTKAHEDTERVTKREHEALNRVRELNDQVMLMQDDFKAQL
jgi:hypothetical protein